MAITNWPLSDLNFWRAVNDVLAVTGSPEATYGEMRRHFEARLEPWNPRGRPVHPIRVAATVIDDRFINETTAPPDDGKN